MSWEHHLLGDFIEIKKGKSITKKESKEGPYPVILGGHEPAYFIDKYNHSGKAIVVSRSGASAGYVSFWNEPIFVTDGFLVEPTSEIDHDFLYFLMKSHENELQGLQGGSAIPHVTPRVINGISVVVPDISTQKRIANICRSFNSLIENNQKQIKLLEEAAQRQYKEWFVDLRFPGHETTPITNGIPEGWQQLLLEQVAPILTGKKDASFSSEDGQYPFFTCAQTPLNAPSYSFDCDAVILAGNGDFNVKLYRGQFEAYQRTYVLSPENKEMLFLLYHAVNNSMAKLAQGASGSTIKFLTKGMIASIPVYVPDELTLDKFNELSEAIQKQIEVLRSSIAYATEARDRLLPKLMNREIEV